MDIFKGLYKEFGWFINALIGIGVIWFVMGGAQNYSARNPYIKPLAPLDTGETYGASYTPSAQNPSQKLDLPKSPAEIVRDAEEKIKDFFTQSEEAKRIHSASLIADSIYLDGAAGAKESSPQKEYLRIVASQRAKSSTVITGLRIEGYGVDGIAIPGAANLPIIGATNRATPVSLPAAGRALISTGKSPIGTSFRVNMCTGYLAQTGSYTPDLRQECPEPLDELRAAGPYEEASCRTFVSGLPKCRSFAGAFPSDVSIACRAFVADRLTYNSCAVRHEKDEDFYKNEWRMFLGSDKALWDDSREIIRLIDSRGRTVDAITY